MSVGVFLAVLAAAFLHAGWNALVKVELDRFSSILAIALVSGIVGLLLLPFFGLPPVTAWPWVVGGSLLHTGYKLFLIRAYRHGDLGQVYPLARGTAPLIVAVVGLVWLGERPGTTEAAAMLAIAVGILSMAAGRRMPRSAVAYALGTACFTASYTLVDGVGARNAGSAASFILSLFVLDGLFMLLVALATRGGAAIGALLPAWRSGVAAGLMSLGSYWIVVWTFTQAPLGLVAALRETSILFAILFGAVLLKEPIGPRRWLAAGLIVGGLALMRL